MTALMEGWVRDHVLPWLPHPLRPLGDTLQASIDSGAALQPRKTEHGQGPAVNLPAYHVSPLEVAPSTAPTDGQIWQRSGLPGQNWSPQ